jgi:hypothetical protein
MSTIDFPADGPSLPERKKLRVDLLIEAIFFSLPASSVQEITDRVNARGLKVTRDDIYEAITYLRQHAKSYKWTIPHVRRGKPYPNRFIIALQEKDGTFSHDKQDRAAVHQGARGSVQYATDLLRNCYTALEFVSVNVGSKYRGAFTDLAEDCKDLNRRCHRVLREMEADGTNN